MDSDSQSPTRFPQPDSHATPQIGRAPYRIPVSRDTQPAHHLIHNEVLGLVRKWRFASVFLPIRDLGDFSRVELSRAKRFR
jgi:hypothetical protein